MSRSVPLQIRTPAEPDEICTQRESLTKARLMALWQGERNGRPVPLGMSLQNLLLYRYESLPKVEDGTSVCNRI